MESTRITPNSEGQEQERGSGLLLRAARTLWFIVSIPLLVLREIYWSLDTDAAVRANGIETEGTVLRTQTETRTVTDGETGEESTITEHFVTYRYDTAEGSHTARKKVDGLGGLKEDSKIVVYFRQPTNRPVTDKDSALDWRPRIYR